MTGPPSTDEDPPTATEPTRGTIMEAASALSSIGGAEGVRRRPAAVTDEAAAAAGSSGRQGNSAPTVPGGAARQQASPEDEDEDASGVASDDESRASEAAPAKGEAVTGGVTPNRNAGSEDDKEEPPPKRYLPENKKPGAAPTFPEKLMKMMKWATKEGVACVQWCEDGTSFVINQPETFTREVVPQFFKPTKFSSFTRKLYRWGFRQVNRGIGPDDPIIFGNEFFQRDHEEYMSKMKSVTAAASRKMEPHHPMGGGLHGKHGLDLLSVEEQNAKRIMLTNQLIQQKAEMLHLAPPNPNVYSFLTAPGQLSLATALRPGTVVGHPGNQQMLMQQIQQLNQSAAMQMPLSMTGADNVHQQLLQLQQMQMLGQDGLQGHESLGPSADFQLAQQQQQLALQMQQQQQQQQQLNAMQQQFPHMAVPAMNAPQLLGAAPGLYDYVPQTAVYSAPGTTVDIVNAAISALRYSN